MWRGDGAGAHVSEGVSGHLKLAGCLVQPGCCHQLSLKYWPSSTHYDVRLRLTAHTQGLQGYSDKYRHFYSKILHLHI